MLEGPDVDSVRDAEVDFALLKKSQALVVS